jgi:hypothetical protein
LLRRASVRDCLDWIMAAARSQNRTCKKIVNLMLARTSWYGFTESDGISSHRVLSVLTNFPFKEMGSQRNVPGNDNQLL